MTRTTAAALALFLAAETWSHVRLESRIGAIEARVVDSAKLSTDAATMAVDGAGVAVDAIEAQATIRDDIDDTSDITTVNPMPPGPNQDIDACRATMERDRSQMMEMIRGAIAVGIRSCRRQLRACGCACEIRGPDWVEP